MKAFSMAIIGATGVVGRTLIDVINETKPPVSDFYLYASDKSYGKTFDILGKTYTVDVLTEKTPPYKKIDVAIFCVNAKISKKYVKYFTRNNVLVIDNSKAFRRYKKVPLVVPEVNGEEIFKNIGIIANPNCSTIQATVALKPLDNEFKLKRVIITTFQSVSGAGRAGVTDLKNGIIGKAPKKFSRTIFGNCIPEIDEFLKNGYTMEEEKIIFESKKILNDEKLKITATCVRVPVFVSHAESINAEFYKTPTRKKVIRILKKTDGIKVLDDKDFKKFPTQKDAEGKNCVFVGRIRKDNSDKHSINLWVVADNLRKGSATNALQTALKYFEKRS